MNERTRDPLESLFERLRHTLGELTPEPLMNRLKEVLESFFEQFQLVPRREFDAHMAKLARLEETVADLEARITELERNH